jgi:hypothetical protein
LCGVLIGTRRLADAQDVFVFEFHAGGNYRMRRHDVADVSPVITDAGKEMGLRVDVLLVKDRTYIKVGFQAAECAFYFPDRVAYLFDGHFCQVGLMCFFFVNKAFFHY